LTPALGGRRPRAKDNGENIQLGSRIEIEKLSTALTQVGAPNALQLVEQHQHNGLGNGLVSFSEPKKHWSCGRNVGKHWLENENMNTHHSGHFTCLATFSWLDPVSAKNGNDLPKTNSNPESKNSHDILTIIV
jgi:hypothetical protein